MIMAGDTQDNRCCLTAQRVTILRGRICVRKLHWLVVMRADGKRGQSERIYSLRKGELNHLG
jgi:hypothetical protein